jgi:hypothetical protein
VDILLNKLVLLKVYQPGALYELQCIITYAGSVC